MRITPLPALTGLRFLLAICVVLYHYGKSTVSGSPWWVASFIHSGFSTVSAFFVLSGFILAHNYVQEDGSLRGSRGEFWAARFARVYPVYLLSVVLSLQAYLTTQAGSPGEAAWAVATTIVCVQAWFPGVALAVNSAAWSLSVEAFLYLCFPFLLAWFAGAGRRRLVWTVIGCALASLAAPAFLLQFPEPAKVWKGFVRYNPVFHLPAFILGIAAHRLWMANVAVIRGWPGALAGAAGLCIAAAFLSNGRIPFEVMNNGLLVLPYAALIVGLASSAGLASRILGHPWMVLLGEASYSLYILHLPLGLFTIAVNGDLLGFEEGSWQALGSTVVLTVFMSIGVFRMVEEPHRKSLRRRLRRVAVAA